MKTISATCLYWFFLVLSLFTLVGCPVLRSTECAIDRPCPDEQQCLVNGTCDDGNNNTPQCDEDEDCSDGFICFQTICREPPGAECGPGVECPQGQVCHEEQCVPTNFCLSDNDCPVGPYICENQKCIFDQPPAECGNNICEVGEFENNSCSDCDPNDPQFCGDGACREENGEFEETCPIDCGEIVTCGDGFVQNEVNGLGDETSVNCAKDVHPAPMRFDGDGCSLAGETGKVFVALDWINNNPAGVLRAFGINWTGTGGLNFNFSQASIVVCDGNFLYAKIGGFQNNVVYNGNYFDSNGGAPSFGDPDHFVFFADGTDIKPVDDRAPHAAFYLSWTMQNGITKPAGNCGGTCSTGFGPGTVPPPACDGDNVCDPGESATNCAACQGCDNDAQCEPANGETAANCAACQTSSAVCGDNVCNGNETFSSCSADCGTATNQFAAPVNQQVSGSFCADFAREYLPGNPTSGKLLVFVPSNSPLSGTMTEPGTTGRLRKCGFVANVEYRVSYTKDDGVTFARFGNVRSQISTINQCSIQVDNAGTPQEQVALEFKFNSSGVLIPMGNAGTSCPAQN